MGKSKPQIPSVSEIAKELKKGTLKNIYFLFGEDTYSIDIMLGQIDKYSSKFISTDFDREILYGDKLTAADIQSASSSFPFGSEKKLLIIKEFEKVRDRKGLQSFLKSPPEFLVLVLLHNTPITSFDSEFYRILAEKGFIYEAKELKGKQLISWLMDYAESKGKILTEENAGLLADISGENRSLLEMQIEKINTFLDVRREITHEDIRALSTALKEFTIFDLQNAIGKRDKAAAHKIAANMLEKGAEPVYILFMLVRYFTALTRINELDSVETNKYAAARIVGTHHFYYQDYQSARKRFNDKELHRGVRALLKADEMLKTTAIDNKTLMVILLNEIL